jgi:hypothetical protein
VQCNIAIHTKNFNITQPYTSTFEMIISIHTAEKTSFNTKDIKFENWYANKKAVVGYKWTVECTSSKMTVPMMH